MTSTSNERSIAIQADPPNPNPAPRRRLSASFWWLVAATGTSGLGNGMVVVAFPLLALHLTTWPIGVAAVLAAERLPWLVISLPAGALADRVDRRRLVATIEVLRALVLGAVSLLVVTNHISLPVVYLAAFLVGALETAFSAATRAALPTLVDPEDLPRANGYLFTAETTGEQFAGPALGGLLFAWIRALPFLGDAISFAGSAALLGVALPPGPRSAATSTVSLLEDMKAGLRWFRQSTLLRRLAPVVAGFAFCQSAVMSIIVIYSLHVLRLSQTGYGLFLALAAIGDVGGNFLAPRAHTRLGPARAIVVAGIAAAAGYLVLAATASWAVALIGFTLEAIAIALGNVATVSLRQQLIPTRLFGRVNNAFRTFVYGAVPIGALAGGIAASVVGLHGTLLLAGLLQLALIVGVARRVTTEIAKSAPGR